MPMIEAVHQGFEREIDVWVVGQEMHGNAAMVERYGLTVPILDDSTLNDDI